MVMRFSRKRTIASAGFALLLAVSVNAGEKVQFRGSTSVTLPKPTRSLDDARSIRLPDGPSGQSEYDAGVAAGTIVTTTSPQMDKKVKEFLDKKKNWIFVNPYDNNYDAKTEEFMEGEKGTGLYEHRLMKEEEKSVMEKFLDERNPRREEEADPENRGKEPERGPNGEVQRPNERSTDRTNERPEPVANSLSAQQPVEKGLSFSVDQKNPTIFGNTSIFDQKPERGGFNDRPLTFTERPERATSKEEMRKERDTRDAEIARMVQPRSAPGGVASRLAPATSADSARLEARPIGGQRTESFLNPGRATAVGGISGGGNSAIFSGGARPSGLPNRPGFDFGPKASSSGGNSFGAASVSSPIAVPRAPVANQPFVLPRPQRKF